jgi:hypothetical protein
VKEIGGTKSAGATRTAPSSMRSMLLWSEIELCLSRSLHSSIVDSWSSCEVDSPEALDSTAAVRVGAAKSPPLPPLPPCSTSPACCCCRSRFRSEARATAFSRRAWTRVQGHAEDLPLFLFFVYITHTHPHRRCVYLLRAKRVAPMGGGDHKLKKEARARA